MLQVKSPHFLDEHFERYKILKYGDEASFFRKKLSFLTGLSEDSFDNFYAYFKSASNTKSFSEIQIKFKKQELLEGLLLYGKALTYSIKKAPELDPTIVVVNVDPYLITGNKFYYRKEDLDKRIFMIRNKGKYLF